MSISISNAGPFFVKGHKETGSLTSHACAMELVACWIGVWRPRKLIGIHAVTTDTAPSVPRACRHASELYSKRTFATLRCFCKSGRVIRMACYCVKTKLSLLFLPHQLPELRASSVVVKFLCILFKALLFRAAVMAGPLPLGSSSLGSAWTPCFY